MYSLARVVQLPPLQHPNPLQVVIKIVPQRKLPSCRERCQLLRKYNVRSFAETMKRVDEPSSVIPATRRLWGSKRNKAIKTVAWENVFQNASHNPLVGLEINLLSHNQHF